MATSHQALTQGRSDASAAAEGSNVIAPAAAASTDGMLFPFKLHRLLEEVSDSDDPPIQWLPDGRAFQIRNRTRFAREILPIYFATTRFRSFQKNLNLWMYETPSRNAFHGGRGCVWRHPLFQRDAPDLCHQMRRRAVSRGNKDNDQQCDKRALGLSSSPSSVGPDRAHHLTMQLPLAAHGARSMPNAEAILSLATIALTSLSSAPPPATRTYPAALYSLLQQKQQQQQQQQLSLLLPSLLGLMRSNGGTEIVTNSVGGMNHPPTHIHPPSIGQMPAAVPNVPTGGTSSIDDVYAIVAGNGFRPGHFK